MTESLPGNRLFLVLLRSSAQIAMTTVLVTLPTQVLGEALILEEVVVTAQKRQESLQDVPISLSAMSGERIENLNLQNAQELADYIPNFAIIQDPIGDKINIRGIQSGNLASFEQSVATYVDGVYRGRGVQARFSFLDPGMVEVLRGPQGTLFGKNTIGGAVNIRSARPTQEFSGDLSVSYNVDFEETEISGYISGPLGDSILARFAFKDHALDKGWVHNNSYDNDIPNTDESAGRFILEWDLSEQTLLTLKMEAGEWDTEGQPWDLITTGAVPGLVGNTDYEAAVGNNGDYVLNTLGLAPELLGDVGPIDFGAGARFAGDSQEVVLKIEHTLENGSTVTAIAANSSYDFERSLDADYNPLPGLRHDDTEDFEQNSIELRIASEAGGDIEYLAGVYYQQDDLEVDGLGLFNGTYLHSYLSDACERGGGVFIPANEDATQVENQLAGTSSEIALNCANAAQLAPLVAFNVPGANRYHYLDQDTESRAAFTQLTWNISNTVRSTVGLRYTYEKKEAGQGAYAADYAAGNTTPTEDPLVLVAAYGIGEFTPHAFDDDDLNRTEEIVTWSANLQWDATDNMMTYATASSGFKGGGYSSFYLGDTNNEGASPDAAEFEREEAIAVEIGAKTSLLDGRAELNVAAFYTEYDNLQVSIFTGATSFIVQNAAEAVTQGLEVDARFLVSENLMLSAAFAYLDFDYENFPNQACTNEQFIKARDIEFQADAGQAISYTNQSCAEDGINDMSGRTSENSPEYQASLIAEHTLPLGQYALSSVLGIVYQDAQYRQADLDPILEDDSFVKTDLTLKFGPLEGSWDIALIGRNLSDETTFSYGNDAPLFSGTRQVFLDQPRNLTLRGSLRF